MRCLASFALVCVLSLTACAAPAPVSPSSPSQTTSSSPYPAPYPYPAPHVPEGPRFTLNPARSTDTQVTGTGPANVPIRIVNITRSGELIAETKIGADGTFVVEAGGKLVKQSMIGVVLGDVTGTSFKRDDFLRGPGYQDLAFVGAIVFATTIVE